MLVQTSLLDYLDKLNRENPLYSNGTEVFGVLKADVNKYLIDDEKPWWIAETGWHYRLVHVSRKTYNVFSEKEIGSSFFLTEEEALAAAADYRRTHADKIFDPSNLDIPWVAWGVDRSFTFIGFMPDGTYLMKEDCQYWNIQRMSTQTLWEKEIVAFTELIKNEHSVMVHRPLDVSNILRKGREDLISLSHLSYMPTDIDPANAFKIPLLYKCDYKGWIYAPAEFQH